MGKIIKLEACEPIPEYTGLENTMSIEIKDGFEWDGHAYAICVGMIMEDGTVKSYFKEDELNENTEIFDKLRKDIHLVEKYCNIRELDSMKLTSGTRYFVPYKVKDHCSNKPTVTDAYVDGCSNVRYLVAYEILLVTDEELIKYIVMEYKTEGTFAVSFFDQVEEIEETFENYFEEEEHGFAVDEDGNRTVTFYDDTGESCNVDINSIHELMSMIASIRVIKCDKKII